MATVAVSVPTVRGNASTYIAGFNSFDYSRVLTYLKIVVGLNENFVPYYLVPNTAAVPPFTKSVSGFIKDETGAGIARAGYVFDEATGKLVSTFTSAPTTGVFTANCWNTNPVMIVLKPDPTDNRNGVILDRIIPV